MVENPIPIEALIFDFDGTLVHLNIDFGAIRQGIERVLSDYGFHSAPLRGLYILEMIDEGARLISERNPSGALSFFRQSHELVTGHEVLAAEQGKILPGVIRTLADLAQRGVKLGIITRNCDKAVRTVFPHIENHCDVFIPRDSVDRVKPHPDHLALAMRRLDLNDPACCYMVGDHAMDIEAGRRMKMKTIGVLTGKTPRGNLEQAGADLIFDDVTKISGHLFGG